MTSDSTVMAIREVGLSAFRNPQNRAHTLREVGLPTLREVGPATLCQSHRQKIFVRSGTFSSRKTLGGSPGEVTKYPANSSHFMWRIWQRATRVFGLPSPTTDSAKRALRVRVWRAGSSAALRRFWAHIQDKVHPARWLGRRIARPWRRADRHGRRGAARVGSGS